MCNVPEPERYCIDTETDVATTSLSLGEHWEVFIQNEVASARNASSANAGGMPLEPGKRS